MTILRSVYVESQDNLVVGGEDGTIYVWGYDEEAKKALQEMSIAEVDQALLKKYGSLLPSTSDLLADEPHSTKEVTVTYTTVVFENIC